MRDTETASCTEKSTKPCEEGPRQRSQDLALGTVSSARVPEPTTTPEEAEPSLKGESGQPETRDRP